MTESEFIEIARQKYGQISELSKSATLYEHEKEFDQIWVSPGAEILEQSLGELPNDKRKKTIQTRYGQVTISNNHRYQVDNTTCQNPYIQ